MIPLSCHAAIRSRVTKSGARRVVLDRGLLYSAGWAQALSGWYCQVALNGETPK
jgi:hypothetical protein